MAVEDLKSSKGTVKTGLRENAIGLPGMLMQGIATIAPSFAILASFVFIVSFAGAVDPVGVPVRRCAAGPAGAVRIPAGQGLPVGRRLVHLDRAGLPPPRGILRRGAVLGLAAAGRRAHAVVPVDTVLEPIIKAYYGVDIEWWIWVIVWMALVIFFAYQGMVLSEKALIITGAIEIVIMVALAISGLASTGPAGSAGRRSTRVTSTWPATCSSAWCSPSSRSAAGNPPADGRGSKNPKRNVPIGLVGSVAMLTVDFVFVTWGYLNGSAWTRPAAYRPRPPGRWPPWPSGSGPAPGSSGASPWRTRR